MGPGGSPVRCLRVDGLGIEGSFHRHSSSKRATTSVDLHRADAVKTQLPGSRMGSEAWWIMLAEIDSWLLQVDKLMA